MSYPEIIHGLSSGGLAIASVAGLHLHSRFDPRREAERLAASPDIKTCDQVIILGFGLGYVVEAVSADQPERPILVIEPDSDWIELALERRRDCGTPFDIPTQSRLVMLSPKHPDQVVASLQESGCRNPGLILNPAIAKIRADSANLVQDAITQFRERSQVNVNTLNKFGKLWVRNLAHNLGCFALRPGIAPLSGLFAGLPGLLLAGGPSLDAVLPRLAELRQRFVLVAVDTSLRACLRVGIDPDFVVMVDPQYWNTRHLDGCSDSRAIVISESAVFPRALRLTQGPVLFCSSLFPLGQFFESRIGIKGSLGAGGSVATSAWDFLRFLGITTIVCAGLDLSFPAGQTHFAGSVFEETTHRDGHRLRPAAQMRYDYLYGAGSYACPDDSGATVLSDRRMDIYAHWFENQFRIHPEIRNQRIGHHSRHIDQLAPLALTACLEFVPVRNHIDRLLCEQQAVVNESCPDTADRLPLARTELIATLKRLATLVDQALNQTRRALEDTHYLPTALRELAAIDQQLIQAANNRIIGFLVENLIQELSIGAAPSEISTALESSRRLYVGLQEACRYHLELFDTGRHS